MTVHISIPPNKTLQLLSIYVQHYACIQENLDNLMRLLMSSGERTALDSVKRT